MFTKDTPVVININISADGDGNTLIVSPEEIKNAVKSAIEELIKER